MVETIKLGKLTKNYIDNHDVICHGVHCVYKEQITTNGRKPLPYIVLTGIDGIRFATIAELKEYIKYYTIHKGIDFSFARSKIITGSCVDMKNSDENTTFLRLDIDPDKWNEKEYTRIRRNISKKIYDKYDRSDVESITFSPIADDMVNVNKMSVSIHWKK